MNCADFEKYLQERIKIGGWAQFGSVHIMNNDHGKVGHSGKKAELAQWHVEKVGPNHEKIKLKSKKSGKYLRIHGNNHEVDCGGGGGKWCVFKVHHGQNDVVKLQGLESGKYLAVREGKVTHGAGGPHCAFKIWR